MNSLLRLLCLLAAAIAFFSCAASFVANVEPPNWRGHHTRSQIQALLPGAHAKGTAVTGPKGLGVEARQTPGKHGAFDSGACPFQGFSPNAVIHPLMPVPFAKGDPTNANPVDPGAGASWAMAGFSRETPRGARYRKGAVYISNGPDQALSRHDHNRLTALEIVGFRGSVTSTRTK